MIKQVLVILAIIAGISSKMCGTSSFACADNATCCRAPQGWRCCPGISSTCCSDGVNCCPFNTICDLRNYRCNAKTNALMFLSSEMATTEPMKVSLPSIADIIACINIAKKDVPVGIEEIKQIYADVSSGKNFTEIIQDLQSLWGMGNELYESCKALVGRH